MPVTLDRGEAERLVHAYSDLILRLSYTYLKSTDDAQDICQTVFLKLLQKPRAFSSPEHEKAWIIRTAVNLCKDHLKSGWRRATVALDAAEAVPAPAEEEGSEKPATVSTQLNRGRQQLRTLLESEGMT